MPKKERERKNQALCFTDFFHLTVLLWKQSALRIYLTGGEITWTGVLSVYLCFYNRSEERQSAMNQAYYNHCIVFDFIHFSELYKRYFTRGGYFVSSEADHYGTNGSWWRKILSVPQKRKKKILALYLK